MDLKDHYTTACKTCWGLGKDLHGAPGREAQACRACQGTGTSPDRTYAARLRGLLREALLHLAGLPKDVAMLRDRIEKALNDPHVH